MNQHTTPAATSIEEPDRPAHASGRQPVLVRELTAADRDRLAAHFIALDDEDRLLRFGQAASDQVIEHYVRAIDFTRDAVFGVFDGGLELVGVGHLAYLPPDGDNRTAEFGVSVLERARGLGIGSKLFERAAMRSRNAHVSTLFMYCLSRNMTMMHIAKKAGMRIEYVKESADCFLTLPPADPTSIIAEMLHEQAAVFDFALKHQTRRTAQILEAMLPSDALA